MARGRTFTFGPGYLEEVALTVSTIAKTSGSTHWRARTRGNVDVFCGAGNHHHHLVTEDLHVWSSEQHSTLMHSARSGDEGAADEISHALVGLSLED